VVRNENVSKTKFLFHFALVCFSSTADMMGSEICLLSIPAKVKYVHRSAKLKVIIRFTIVLFLLFEKLINVFPPYIFRFHLFPSSRFMEL
jgi:hypothetical protein